MYKFVDLGNNNSDGRKIKMKTKITFIICCISFAILYGCGDNSNPVNNNNEVLGNLDSIYVENINNLGDSAAGEIHLNRLVQQIKIKYELESNADSNNEPKINIKFGEAQQTIINLSPSNEIILTNSMVDSDVFFKIFIKSQNNIQTYLKLKNIKIY